MADDKKKDKDKDKDDDQKKTGDNSTVAITSLGKTLFIYLFWFAVILLVVGFLGKMKGCSGSSHGRAEVVMSTFDYSQDDEAVRALERFDQIRFNEEVAERLVAVFNLPSNEVRKQLTESGELATEEFRAALAKAYGLQFNGWLPAWYRDGQCMLPATTSELRSLVYRPSTHPRNTQKFTYHIDVTVNGRWPACKSRTFPIAGWDISVSSAKDEQPVDHLIIADPGESNQKFYLHQNPKKVPEATAVTEGRALKKKQPPASETFILSEGKWKPVDYWQATNTFAVAILQDSHEQTKIFRITRKLRNE